jgi:alkylation response protein AidB-like acyl-CoA dehydrogenase
MKQEIDSSVLPEDFYWWRDCQLLNFYERNDDLLCGLRLYSRNKQRFEEYEERLIRFGASAATIINDAAETSNTPEHLPILESVRRDGDDLQQVRYHDSYHAIGSLLYGTGVMQLFSAPSDNVLGMAFLHLLALNGEAGHACSFACTAGLIKVMGALGTADQKQRHLPRLLETDYTKVHHAAQYLTESRGGSDVGANQTIAEPDPEGEDAWLITGEKSFCSNVTAPLAVLTARPRGAPEGTRGLGLFVLPQRLTDGTSNGIEIIRLKNKLGTKSLATVEIVLKQARAEALGPIDRGFKNMMTYVVNTSRLCNCVFAAGAAQRAFLTAELYADHRVAFGKRLNTFPLIQHTLAVMKAKASAILSASLCLAGMLDDLESASATPGITTDLYRVLLNVSKYRSSLLARESVLDAIECMGGNGTIEDFSILPRLLRDGVVYETWEGAHNVLVAQTFRDLQKHTTVGLAFDYLESAFRSVAVPVLDAMKSGALHLVELLRKWMTSELENDPREPSWQFRTAVSLFGDLFFLSQICARANWAAQNALETESVGNARKLWDRLCYSEGAARLLLEFQIQSSNEIGTSLPLFTPHIVGQR